LQSHIVWLPDLAVCIIAGCYGIPSPEGEGFTDPQKGTLNWILEILEQEVHVIQFVEQPGIILKVKQAAVCEAL